jgi:cytochrome c peroxidase
MRPQPRALALAALSLAVGLATTATIRTQSLIGALPATPPLAPADNPTTPDKVALGKLLFWDPLLSGNRDVACATCHHPEFGYAEPLDLSIGVDGVGLGTTRRFADGTTIPFVKRNSQTVLNSAFNGMDATGGHTPAEAPMFWDLRVRSLEAQALEPIKALEEMRGNAYTEDKAIESVVQRVAANAEYRALFARAFGRGDTVTAVNLSRAIAAFERTLVTANAPFDRYMRGDENAMTPAQVNGMRRFENAGCTGCHNGPMFSDFKVHVLGVADNAKLTQSDTGANGTYAFRTPTLRNLKYTAPYMHSGVFSSLDEVVQFYNGRGGRGGGRGGGFGRSRNPNVGRDALDPLLRRVNVRGNRRDFVEFLNALNDDTFDRTVPARVPSGLQVGGKIN